MQSKTGLLGWIEPSPPGALGSTSPCLHTLNHSWHYEKERKDSQRRPLSFLVFIRRVKRMTRVAGLGSNTSMLFLPRSMSSRRNPSLVYFARKGFGDPQDNKVYKERSVPLVLGEKISFTDQPRR
jgi:hypothetical protein